MSHFRIERTDGTAQDLEGRYEVFESGLLVVIPDGDQPFVLPPNWARLTVLDQPLRDDLAPRPVLRGEVARWIGPDATVGD